MIVVYNRLENLAGQMCGCVFELKALKYCSKNLKHMKTGNSFIYKDDGFLQCVLVCANEKSFEDPRGISGSSSFTAKPPKNVKKFCKNVHHVLYYVLFLFDKGFPLQVKLILSH